VRLVTSLSKKLSWCQMGAVKCCIMKSVAEDGLSLSKYTLSLICHWWKKAEQRNASTMKRKLIWLVR